MSESRTLLVMCPEGYEKRQDEICNSFKEYLVSNVLREDGTEMHLTTCSALFRVMLEDATSLAKSTGQSPDKVQEALQKFVNQYFALVLKAGIIETTDEAREAFLKD